MVFPEKLLVATPFFLIH